MIDDVIKDLILAVLQKLGDLSAQSICVIGRERREIHGRYTFHSGEFSEVRVLAPYVELSARHAQQRQVGGMCAWQVPADLNVLARERWISPEVVDVLCLGLSKTAIS